MAERKSFGRLRNVLEMPDLIDLQISSYKNFLQRDTPPEERKRQGLQELFMDFFPIMGWDSKSKLDFVSYEIGEVPEKKRDYIECIKDSKIYDAPLRVKLRLTRSDGSVVEEVVNFCDLPLMTDHGTFIINGAERVIISQLHRSPGICFENITHLGKRSYSYRIIPDRGNWMDVQFNSKEQIEIFLDRRRRRRKFFITTFLRAIGYEDTRDLVRAFYPIRKFQLAKLLVMDENKLKLNYTFAPVKDANGEVVIDEYQPMESKYLAELQDHGVEELDLAVVPAGEDFIFKTLQADKHVVDKDSALQEIYRKMRPGDPVNIDNAGNMVKRLFFDNRRYDLGLVGRFKLNERLKQEGMVPADLRTLDKLDLVTATKEMMHLYAINAKGDDIDHLGARRVRTVGELLQNQCRDGMARTERFIRERMSNESEKTTPSSLINTKIFQNVVREFFMRSQLSQFMDQNNPLSELTNKRRFSALGPGGLSRDRAGFEVRDVHSSHYGRICPIETPEGPNIGLISSMALYARINDYGFLETPYRVVVDGRVTDDVQYLTADKEEQHIIAQANALLDGDNRFIRAKVMCRHLGESGEFPRESIDLMDVSPKQLVSAAAGIIPFLEHDDANRALMGSNMQRQGVPLLNPESPYVGTGLEQKIAQDSRAVILAKRDGIVYSVCSERIVVTDDGCAPRGKEGKENNTETYRLYKYMRSNASTAINQRPLVRSGQKVVKGELLADGASTQNGELALGRNVLVAFMPWCGYNFEDAIIVSERLVKEDIFTSVHVEEFSTESEETKLGPEEITREIPNAGEEKLRNLDISGVVYEGAEVGAGDILVGKITPKGEMSELPPEERLLRAIFQTSANNVKDTSLVVPQGKGGIVMDIRIEHAQVKPSGRNATKAQRKEEEKKIRMEVRETSSVLMADLFQELSNILMGKKLVSDICAGSGEDLKVLVPANRKLTRSTILKLANHYETWYMSPGPEHDMIAEIIDRYLPKFRSNRERLNNMGSAAVSEEDLGPIKKVKVYVACKRKLQIGDKMAGRHGNKGIVSRIVAVEDMPFLADGTPVDIVLNPLGVPSRMNVGQVLETHLGWAAKMLGLKVATPVFDGASEADIQDMMTRANEQFAVENGHNYHWGFRKNANGDYVFDGKTDVFDGRTGDRFDQRIMVGQIYMLKLDHLVANKIHARSVGPYSMVTQQPLGGKAQRGGQRFGEMEVWALEAYGAAYNLQEMLTVKSDDVAGRSRIYNSIVKGQNVLSAGRPESFNVLLKEMQSLCLDIRTISTDKEQ